jgi:hypothetical protein
MEQPINASYTAHVEGRSAEEILANVSASGPGPLGEYLRIAAQVRSQLELEKALREESASSTRVAKIIGWAVVFASVLQSVVTLLHK